MTDFFNDISNIPAEYTIYVTFLLGLIVKFLWIWNIEYHFTNSMTDPHNIASPVNQSLQRMKYYVIVNTFLSWFIKCIRKKEGSNDDADGIASINLKTDKLIGGIFNEKKEKYLSFCNAICCNIASISMSGSTRSK
ncbi:hypothetical protein KDN24_11255 [Bacillus sp. Bva_UNVM-123]|uniref:hypothetical protein n=1 Tax=Bacillus sp. Bva_UNVM-123 TaxID=2829798 RepID=UPI00391F25B1